MDIPYVVSRRGVGIFINKQLIMKNKWPRSEYRIKEDPGNSPKGITKTSTFNDLHKNSFDENHWIRERLFTDKVQKAIEDGKQYVKRIYKQIVNGKVIKYAATFMHSTYLDNRFVDDVYKAKLLNLINEDTNYYNVYCLGKWGILKGLIFEHWDIVDDIPEKIDQRGFGLDFGFSSAPTTVVEVAFKDKELYIKEHLYETGMTNDVITKHLKGITAGHADCPTVADSAEPKSIAEIRNNGHPCMPSIKGPDSVVYGIQRMKQYHLHVCKDSPNLIKELHAYKWAEDKNGVQLNKPVGFNDHAIDAARYIISKLKSGVRVDMKAPQEEKQEDPTTEDLMENEAIWR